MEDRRATDLYRRAEQELTSMASAIQRQESIDLAALSALAKDITGSIGRDDQLLVQALAGPSGSTLITNLINVSILATKVGSGLGYYGQELQRLTLAGLMHDIGLFAVPQSIVTKSGQLTCEERTLIDSIRSWAISWCTSSAPSGTGSRKSSGRRMNDPTGGAIRTG